MFSSAWITLWTRDDTYAIQSQSFYVAIYAVLATTLTILTYLRTILLVRFGIRASDTIHRDLMQSILNAPQRFSNTTPVSRILSRFSKDIYPLDVELVACLDFFPILCDHRTYQCWDNCLYHSSFCYWDSPTCNFVFLFHELL